MKKSFSQPCLFAYTVDENIKIKGKIIYKLTALKLLMIYKYTAISKKLFDLLDFSGKK